MEESRNMIRNFFQKESVSILGYIVLLYFIFKESDLLLYKICALLIVIGSVVNLYFIDKSKTVKSMNQEELFVIKSMISSKQSEASIIKKIREYTNLDIVKAKQFYDELK